MSVGCPEPLELWSIDEPGLNWRRGTLDDANRLLARWHYLGPVRSGRVEVVVLGVLDGSPVAAQVWKRPTSRRLPNDGSFIELCRWVLTPDAGPNAGSRQHRASLSILRETLARTLVSYSDRSVGHTGALYRACNWLWAPTWQRLRRPPSGGGAWRPDCPQEPKDRWVFHLQRNDAGRDALRLTDRGAIRHWLATGTDAERSWADQSPYMRAAINWAAQ